MQFLKGSVKARHALLWIMLKRKTPPLKYAEVQFSMAEVDVVFGDEELAAIVQALEAKAASEDGLDNEEQMTLEALRKMVPENYTPSLHEALPPSSN